MFHQGWLVCLCCDTPPNKYTFDLKTWASRKGFLVPACSHHLHMRAFVHMHTHTPFIKMMVDENLSDMGLWSFPVNILVLSYLLVVGKGIKL